MPNAPLITGLSRLGVDVPRLPGSRRSDLFSLRSAFSAAGFVGIETTVFDATVRFRDFDEFWASQTPCFSPLMSIIGSLGESDRFELIEFIRTQVLDSDGGASWTARANAVRALVP